MKKINLKNRKQNRTSHIALHTSQKGITLIALIITIIVMLILVGVTINVALNGGLFQKAETAKTQTQREVEKEELTVIAIAAYDEKTRKVDQSKLELGEKYSIATDKTTEEKIMITGQCGITWKIDVKSGKVEEYNKITEDSDLDYIKTFFIGTDIDSISTKIEIDEETGMPSLDNGNIMFCGATLKEMKNKYAPGEGLVLYKQNFYEVKYNYEAIAYDVYKWGTNMPVVVLEGGGGYYGDVEPSLSNTAFQRAGEYKTTIILGNGQYNVVDNNITVEINSWMNGKTYVEGTDYTFNTSTGEIVIFNLTEIVSVDMQVNRKTT